MPETKKTAKKSGTAKVQGAVAPKMRKATRQEKITKPAVYEVPVAQTPKTQKPKIGRPTIFKQEIADIICIMLSEGMSLRQILKADTEGKLPAQSTIYEWLIRFPVFAEQYARAREEQADTNADEILEIADEMPPEYTDKDGRTSLDQTYIAWQKNRIEARKWTAAKLRPKKYGDRMAVEGVEGGAAIKTEDTGANKFLDIIKNMEMTKRAG
jgi:hypothetical protein